jgi:hypothetical protein
MRTSFTSIVREAGDLSAGVFLAPLGSVGSRAVAIDLMKPRPIGAYGSLSCPS